ncbi:MAG: response regulator transcription factor [Bacteroidetes bacterium]|jgi:two-component system LytT family response regulator|nr:response regulator transcription factor [Bacteroidota bacterium]
MKAVIIDDEKRSRESLAALVQEYCAEVEVLAHAEGVTDGLDAIGVHKPNLLFLDIELQDGTGFDLLEKAGNNQFHVIFTTAFENYALRALKMSAVDYLLKPIDPAELTKAVAKARERLAAQQHGRNFEILLQNIQAGGGKHKIALPSSDGLTFVNVSDIIRCEADGSYTHFFFKEHKKILVSKKIKEYEELLSPYQFVRVHHSHLVNLNEVAKYVRGDGGYVVMSDGQTVYVSKRKKDDFMSALNKA